MSTELFCEKVRKKKIVYLCVIWKQRGLNSILPKQKVKRKHALEQSKWYIWSKNWDQQKARHY